MEHHRKRRLKRLSLKALKAHPKQDELFSDLPEDQLRALADAMDREGVTSPIEVLPDGTIICGHQRVRAARLLGWQTIPCVIRNDLDEAAAELRLIEDNLHRRQLDPIAVGRLYQRVKRLAQQSGEHRLGGDIRDALGKSMGCSGRTLDRKVRLALAPVEVQLAVKARKLTQADAVRVSLLPAATQEKIAAELRKGTHPKKVLSFFGVQEPRPVPINTLMTRVVRDLKQHARALDGRVPEVTASYWAKERSTFAAASKLYLKLSQQIQSAAASRSDRQQSAITKINRLRGKQPAASRTRRPRRQDRD